MGTCPRGAASARIRRMASQPSSTGNPKFIKIRSGGTVTMTVPTTPGDYEFRFLTLAAGSTTEFVVLSRAPAITVG